MRSHRGALKPEWQVLPEESVTRDPKQAPRRAHPRDATSSEHRSRERAECPRRSQGPAEAGGRLCPERGALGVPRTDSEHGVCQHRPPPPALTGPPSGPRTDWGRTRLFVQLPGPQPRQTAAPEPRSQHGPPPASGRPERRRAKPRGRSHAAAKGSSGEAAETDARPGDVGGQVA